MVLLPVRSVPAKLRIVAGSQIQNEVTTMELTIDYLAEELRNERKAQRQARNSGKHERVAKMLTKLVKPEPVIIDFFAIATMGD